MRLFALIHGFSQDGVSIHASVKDATMPYRMEAGTVGFNPRICKRCDIAPFAKNAFTNVSIHASVKDATLFRVFRRVVLDVVSIHASVKDATVIGAANPQSVGFQSTHL